MEDWVQELYADAEVDEELQEVLRGTGGDPEKIRANMRAANAAAEARLVDAHQGSSEAMRVEFREVDTMSLWIWLELRRAPADSEVELLQAVTQAWFMLGKLGGYNASNLQVRYATPEKTDGVGVGVTIGWMDGWVITRRERERERDHA